MLKEVLSSYEKVFLASAHDALKDATNYLIANNKAKTLVEISKKLDVSASTLTQYISGDKSISKHFMEKLKIVYGIDLINPLSYEDHSWKNDFLKAGYGPVEASIHLKVYFSFRTIIDQQQQIIEGLRKSNAGLKKVNTELFDLVIKNEKVLVEAMFKEPLKK